MKIFENKAALAAASLKEGQIVTTKGYYTAGDGGGANYLVVPSQAADGYGDHVLANGNVAVLQHGGVLNVKKFGAKGNGSDTDSDNIIAAYASISRGKVYLPAGIYIVEDTISLKPAVSLAGDGAEVSMLRIKAGVTVDPVIKADYTGFGNDYIYVSGMTVDCNKGNGSVGRGIVYQNVHVPSFIEDVTVLSSTTTNIDISNCSVVELSRVWSNSGQIYALDIDTVRSLNILGGAYEHARGMHIRIQNTGGFIYPQVFMLGVHIEGLLEDDVCAIEIGGGAAYNTIVGLSISGMQVLGKNPTPSGNFIFRLLNNNVALSVHGLSKTGDNGWGSTFSAGTPIPPTSANSITQWEYNGNRTSGYSLTSGYTGTQNKDQVELVKVAAFNVTAFTVTEVTQTLPAQIDTNYDVHLTQQGYLGNNLIAYVDESSKTTTNFKVKFVNSTTGAAAQLANTTRFVVQVSRNR